AGSGSEEGEKLGVRLEGQRILLRRAIERNGCHAVGDGKADVFRGKRGKGAGGHGPGRFAAVTRGADRLTLARSSIVPAISRWLRSARSSATHCSWAAARRPK